MLVPAMPRRLPSRSARVLIELILGNQEAAEGGGIGRKLQIVPLARSRSAHVQSVTMTSASPAEKRHRTGLIICHLDDLEIEIVFLVEPIKPDRLDQPA